MAWRTTILCALILAAAAAAASGETGLASFYAGKFQGRRTANGEVFDTNAMTAAHKTLPFNTLVRVTNSANGKSVVVRINDRGPFVEGRVVDLSRAAAAAIDLVGLGVAPVSLEILELGDGRTYHHVTVPSETVTIQIGAFSDPNNARRVAESVSAAGLSPTFEAAPSGVTRVVLSGVRRAELPAVLDKLARIGYGDPLVRAGRQ